MKRPVEQLIDEILVMDAQDGNVKAMEKLVSRWQKRLELRIAELSNAVKEK
jgi:hypothetical protein